MTVGLDDLRASLGTVSNVSNALLDRALETATFHVKAEVYDDHWEHPDVQYAVLLWASRWYKRRQSPEGVAGWGDLGVIRVLASDPDIQELLAPHRDPRKYLVAG